MILPLAVINDLFLVIVVSVAFLYLNKQLYKSHYGHKLIKIMFYAVFALLIFDVIVNFSEDYNHRRLEEVFLSITSSIIPLIGFLWLLYIRSVAKFKIKSRPIWLVALVLLSANIVLSVMTFASDIEIYFNYDQGFAEVGRLYFVFGIITLLPYILATIMLLIQWNSMRKRRRPVVFLVVSAFPLLGVFAQTLSVDYTISLSSIVVTFIIICLDIQHQFAVTDYMTGLYNRRRLSQKLTERIRKMKQDAIFAGYMIDLNNFKMINDEYGHSFGDRILQDFAAVLLATVGPTDLVSRFGGDEFVIIKDIKTPNELNLFKQKLLTAVEEYNAAPTTTQKIELSIGADIYVKKSDYTAEHFLEVIDEKMYRDKKKLKAAS